jgi:hypothetical protein
MSISITSYQDYQGRSRQRPIKCDIILIGAQLIGISKVINPQIIEILRSRPKQQVTKEIRIYIGTAPNQRFWQVIEKIESKHRIQPFIKEDHDGIQVSLEHVRQQEGKNP